MLTYTPTKPTAGATMNRAAPLDLSRNELADYSIKRALNAAMLESNESSLEREITRTCLKRVGDNDNDPRRIVVPFEVLFGRRDLVTTPGSAGGVLVATTVGPHTDSARYAPVLRTMGAEFVSGLVGNVSLPRSKAKATVVFQSTEATQATETTNLDFGAMAATPKTAVATIDMSRLTRMSGPLVEQVVRAELAATAAEVEDEQALAGTGAAGQPTGIINTPGIGSFNGTSITYANTREAETDVLGVSAARSGGVGFACRPAIASLLAQRNGHSANAPIWTGPLAAGLVNGCRAVSSMAMPASTLLCGDFTQLLVLQWGLGVEIRVNPYAGFTQGVVSAVMFYSFDIAVRNPAAFSLATGVT